jgi:Ca2+-binding RTX toxin-like protein
MLPLPGLARAPLTLLVCAALALAGCAGDPDAADEPLVTPPVTGGDPCADASTATILGTEGPDDIDGTDDDDIIFALGGDDVVRAHSGNDIVCGGEGDDRLGGGPGDDHLDGGDGNDTCMDGPGAGERVGCEA